MVDIGDSGKNTNKNKNESFFSILFKNRDWLKRIILGSDDLETCDNCCEVQPMNWDQGVDAGFIAQFEADMSCLKDRYSKIWSENDNREQVKENSENISYDQRPKSRLKNSGVKCNRVGEIRSYGEMTSVCLECLECDKNNNAEIRFVDVESIPRGECMVDDSCPHTDHGYWYNLEFARYSSYSGELNVQKLGPQLSTTGTEYCEPEYIYDETGCHIVGVKPMVLARGKLAYWESTEIYPDTKDCDGNYIYGEDGRLGNPIRHHKMPDRTIEPHFLSTTKGVPHSLDPGNTEWKNTWVRIIQLEIRGLKLPEKTAKPLNKENPFTIMIMPRDATNKSVIASGLFTNTFKGFIHGEPYAIPKNGVNSVEYFDRNIYYGARDTHRGGENMDVMAMNFHSPDTQFDRPALNVNQVKFELNLLGQGWKFGQFGEGEDPESFYLGKENQRGTRQSINMSQYSLPEKAISRCIKGVSYASNNKIIDKENKFTYPLMNLFRESSVYIETRGSIVRLLNTRNAGQNRINNNGHPGETTSYDGTSDLSFLGSTLWHEEYIYDASAFYGTIKAYIPDQYGNLVNAIYHELYNITKEDLNKEIIGVDAGDSFVGQHHIVRKSYVSDKTMEKTAVLAIGGGFNSDMEPNDKMPVYIPKLLRRIFETIGAEKCNTCPKSGAIGDARNGVAFSLRQSGIVPWDGGMSSIPKSSGTDIYYPHLLKTNITYIAESDVNLHYRQLGNRDNGEVYYRNLKGLNFDSAFPSDSPWTKGFMNRFYIKMNENPQWKMLLRVIINFLFTYGIGLWIIIEGLVVFLDALSNIGGGLLKLIPGAIAIVLSIVLINLGILWIMFWANSDRDNKFWDNVLGIKGCYPDKTRGANRKHSGDSRFMTSDGKVEQFEDNYFMYNYDHSKTNNFDIGVGLPDPYSQKTCENEPGFEIYHSNKQNPTSPIDAYRNFKVNSYIQIPSDTGKIQKMFTIGGNIFVQTTDAMYNLRYNSPSLQTNEGGEVYTGTSNIVRAPIQIFSGIPEGKGGTRDPNASEITELGLINVDVESRSIDIFNGSTFTPVFGFGMKKFFDRFMPFRNEGIRDQKTPGGIGYSLGFDRTRNYLHISKQDGDLSWTITVDLMDKSIVGFEYFVPLVYHWDRHNIYSFNDNKFWKHNAYGKYLEVYGRPVDMIIDFVIKEDSTRGDFAWRNSVIESEFEVFDGNGFVVDDKFHFDFVGAHNTFQSSGLMPTIDKDTQDTIERIRENPNILPMQNIGRGKWRFNKLVDKVQNLGVRHMTSLEEGVFTDFTEAGFGDGSSMSNSIVDNFLIMRLVFSGKDRNRVKVRLKRVITNDNLEERLE